MVISDPAADWMGRTIRPFTHVRVIHRQHHQFGRTGTVVRVLGHRAWVAMPGGKVVRVGLRSIEVVVPRPRDKTA